MKRMFIFFAISIALPGIAADVPGLKCASQGQEFALSPAVFGYEGRLTLGQTVHPLAVGMDCQFKDKQVDCDAAPDEGEVVGSRVNVKLDDGKFAIAVMSARVFPFKLRDLPKFPDGLTEPPPSTDAGDFNETFVFNEKECSFAAQPAPSYAPRVKLNRVAIEIKRSYAKEHQKEVMAGLSDNYLSSGLSIALTELKVGNLTIIGYAPCLTKASCMKLKQSMKQAEVTPSSFDKRVPLYKKVDFKDTYVVIHGVRSEFSPNPNVPHTKKPYTEYRKDAVVELTSDDRSKKRIENSEKALTDSPIADFVKAGVTVTSYNLTALPGENRLYNAIIGGYIVCEDKENDLCTDKIDALKKHPLAETVQPGQ